MDEQKPDPSLSSVLNLHRSTDANQLIQSNQAVVEYYADVMATREQCYDFLAGNQWTDEEREIARQKKKTLIEFNKLKPSERTFVGNIIQQRFDVMPAPREPSDQNKADIYAAMYYWQADTCDTKYKDPGLIRNAWAGGSSWQESYVEVTPGKKPRVITENQNDFAIYPDPNRRDLVNNHDCDFIDRLSWMTKDAIIEAVPEKEELIEQSLMDFLTSRYDTTKTYADRTHEFENVRNGKFKVIERFYKVRKKNWFGINGEEKIDIGQDADMATRKQFQADYPEHTVYYEREEFLYLAICVPAMGGEFLYNGEYHCQPRDPVTTRIMFPLVELVDEDLNGTPTGHVQPQIGPIRVLNSLAVNTIAAVKNAAGQAHVASSDHFDEDTQADVQANLSDGSRTFMKKKGAPEGSGVYLVEQGGAARDNNGLMTFVATFQEEVSSTPPNMKGEVVNSESGVLNEQRIHQSGIQAQVFNNNYMSFLTRRAKLWKYYWKNYFKAEDVIRVMQKKDDNDPDWIEINKIIQDEFGNVQTKNSLDDADAYDMTFQDSWQSPTVRGKILQQIAQLQQNGGAANDPEMSALINYYFLTMSDAPQEFKSKAKAIHDKREEQANQPPAPPQPEPMRVSMSIKGEDLHDAAVVTFMEANHAISPEVAQQMLGTPPPPPSPDVAAQAAKAHAEIQNTHADTHGKHITNLQQAGILPQPVSPQGPPQGSPTPAARPTPSMAGA